MMIIQVASNLLINGILNVHEMIQVS